MAYQERIDVAITIIGEYVDEHLYDLALTYPNNGFEDRSYARWAAYELIRRLDAEDQRLPPHIASVHHECLTTVDIIVDFIDEMEWARYNSRTAKQQHIFLIGHEVAKEIILLFL